MGCHVKVTKLKAIEIVSQWFYNFLVNASHEELCSFITNNLAKRDWSFQPGEMEYGVDGYLDENLMRGKIY